MRDDFLTQLVQSRGICVSHCPCPEDGDGVTRLFWSSDGNPEPENGLSRSRSGKGARCWESQTGTPQGCPAAGWHGLSLGHLSWALGWLLHPSALGLSQLVLSSPSYCTVGFQGCFPQHPAFLLLQTPLEQAWEIPTGAKPCLGVGDWCLLGLSKTKLLKIPPSPVAGLLVGLEDGGPGSSPWDGEHAWVAAPGPSSPVTLGGWVT